ncbi:MAG TPA: Ig-like domain-containing protein, partial [Anaerolineae bacterium]|nr:Ig-like domain-containing protein [Anaerolineae bacterium]
FAAFFDNKGPTDWTEWYYETVDLVSDGYSSQNTHRQWMERECYSGVNTPQDPTENPFCFQRRSGFSYASNLIHTPISNTHSVNDILVPIHHSRELRDAINSYGPDQLASLYEDTVVGPTCPQTNMSEPSSYYHCYEPDDTAIFNFLEQHTLNNNPSHINIVTDQSNSFYWLNLVQTGAPHFSRVQAAYNLANKTVTATIVDTSTLTVAFNLGSTPITNIIDQPGMGLPAMTYLVKFPGSSTLKNYTSGYLTTTLTTTGQFSLTISAITPQVSASPPNIPNNGLATSIVTVIVKDQLNQAVPNGTPVQFSTTLGTFPNGTSADTANVSGGAGQAQIVLRAGLTPGVAQVVATVGTASGGTSVTVGSVSVYLPIVIRN